MYHSWLYPHINVNNNEREFIIENFERAPLTSRAAFQLKYIVHFTL